MSGKDAPMPALITTAQLRDCGLLPDKADVLTATINSYLTESSNSSAWQKISTHVLTPDLPFNLHLFLFKHCYPDWQTKPEHCPAWLPDAESLTTSNIGQWMTETGMKTVAEFHAWTVNQYQKFWETVLQKLHIIFQTPPKQICDLTSGIESPQWLAGAAMNISESCFTAAPDATAIIYYDHNQRLQKLSYASLNKLANRIANGLHERGFAAGDPIAIIMPMSMEAVAIYLGILKLGAVVVPIADSFSSNEIATRLTITGAKIIFTQDFILRSQTTLPLYKKIITAKVHTTIVISHVEAPAKLLRENDLAWETFLSANDKFAAQMLTPMAPCTILFSSGTTAEPKAIIWNHTTAIKAASDAFLHQDIQTTDVLAWPTNLGWMMGPWLIFAALINRATLALNPGNPNERAYGEFVQDAKITMLGVVPTLVASWRRNQCMQGLNWNTIQKFSSTGECSNAEDMLYLMSQAYYKPVIEYCGGTEIGGGYISSTIIQVNCPTLFSTPAMGSAFILLDESGQPSNIGEVALIPPALGLATELLNADQHKIYYSNMPKSPTGKILRRHGDQLRRFDNGSYQMLGRTDDTMNLSGIKISSAEIERVLVGMEGITETAAVGITPPQNGPSQLVIFAVTELNLSKEDILAAMQKRVNQYLNPLFKIHDIVFTTELAKTASQKILRGKLRKMYAECRIHP
jgi:acetyl-CoA synthetase